MESIESWGFIFGWSTLLRTILWQQCSSQRHQNVRYLQVETVESICYLILERVRSVHLIKGNIERYANPYMTEHHLDFNRTLYNYIIVRLFAPHCFTSPEALCTVWQRAFDWADSLLLQWSSRNRRWCLMSPFILKNFLFFCRSAFIVPWKFRTSGLMRGDRGIAIFQVDCIMDINFC